MTNPVDPSDRSLGSYLGLGSLLIVAGLLTYGIHGLYAEWPAGFDGWVGALFLVTGVVFMGLSIVAKVRARRTAIENGRPRP